MRHAKTAIIAIETTVMRSLVNPLAGSLTLTIFLIIYPHKAPMTAMTTSRTTTSHDITFFLSSMR